MHNPLISLPPKKHSQKQPNIKPTKPSPQRSKRKSSNRCCCVVPLHNVNLSKNIYSENGKIWNDEMGRDGRLGLALGITCVTVLQYRVEDGKGTESCLFQEVSTADLEARHDAQLGLKEPQFLVGKSQDFGIWEVE